MLGLRQRVQRHGFGVAVAVQHVDMADVSLGDVVQLTWLGIRDGRVLGPVGPEKPL